MPNPTGYPGVKSAALQRVAYPYLVPLTLSLRPDRAYALALDLVRKLGWEIVANEPGDGRIEAISRSLVYRFADEIVIRVGSSGDGARIDVRSRSRIGRIDRGVNAKRIRAFLTELKEKADLTNQ
jgi:uncharacterized protein (DUF1499 family)